MKILGINFANAILTEEDVHDTSEIVLEPAIKSHSFNNDKE